MVLDSKSDVVNFFTSILSTQNFCSSCVSTWRPLSNKASFFFLSIIMHPHNEILVFTLASWWCQTVNRKRPYVSSILILSLCKFGTSLAHPSFDPFLFSSFFSFAFLCVKAPHSTAQMQAGRTHDRVREKRVEKKSTTDACSCSCRCINGRGRVQLGVQIQPRII